MAKGPPKPPDPGVQMWDRVKQTVRPLRGKAVGAPVVHLGKTTDPTPTRTGPVDRLGDGRVADPLKGRGLATPQPFVIPLDLFDRAPAKSPSPSGEGLGVGTVHKKPASVGSPPLAKDWERNFRAGRLAPDMTIDLHGHHLASAHSALTRALDRAVAAGTRVILVVAGKTRGPDEAPRGAIRRELTTWLSHSPHAGKILAVRNAHPRHGGAGAVYVVLRK